MYWSEERELAHTSIEALNEIIKNKGAKLLASDNRRIDFYAERVLSIKTNGQMPTWKIVWAGNSPISEGFRTWKEVRIYLSGMRGILNLL